MSRSPLFDIYDPYGILGQQAELGILPSQDEELEVTGAFPVRRKPQITDLLPEDEKRGMLSSLANLGASGLTGLGWLLDTPGALVRGTVSGLASGDPLKGLRTVFASSDDRVSGRDLLRQFGGAGQQDTWGNFASGIAAEALLDPLTYLNPLSILGKGALGAAGKTLNRAGLLENASLAARQQDMGIREFLRRPAREIIGLSDDSDAMLKFSQAARAKGYDVDELLNQPAASLMEFKLPGYDSGTLLGTGDMGAAISRGLDRTGEFLRTNPATGAVVNRLTSAFDPSVMGAIDPDKQWRNRAAWAEAKAGERELLEWAAERQRAANQVTHNDFTFSDPRIQNAIRDTIEAKRDPTRMSRLFDKEAVAALEAVPEWRAWRDEVADKLTEYQSRRSALGLQAPDAQSLEDIGFFPAQSVWFDRPEAPILPNRLDRQQRAYNRGKRVLNVDDLVGRARDPKTDLPNRSETFRRLMTGDFGRTLQDQLIKANDQQIPGLLDAAFDALGIDRPYEKLRGADGLTANEMEYALNNIFVLSPQVRKGYESSIPGLRSQQEGLKVALGDLLRKSDRQFSSKNVGLFDNNTVNDFVRYGAGQARSEANAKVILDDLVKNVSPMPANSVAGGGQLNLLEEAAGLGFNPSALKDVLAQRLRMAPDDIANLSINEKIIADLKKLSPIREAPESTARGRFWDTFTNAFKVGSLANPAYHTRNLYSGFLSTLMADSPKEIGSNILDWYAGLQAGKGNYDALYGRIQNSPRYANMDKEDAINAFLAEAARNRLGGGFVMDAEGIPEQAARSLYPGGDTVDPIKFFDRDRTLSDWATVRGVDWAGIFGDRAAPNATLNPLLQLHERLGRRTEDANRLGTYISQIRQGASPDAAAGMVYKTQVDYSPRAFTDFERQIKQYVPFYSYTRGIAPVVAENLLYRPGGLQSQTIRAISSASQPNEDFFTPEYLRQSAAIPLPGMSPTEGLQRFLTNIDLPYEGLVNLVSPGIGNTPTQVATDSIRKTGMNLLGMLNPIIKAPLEYVLNRQLYSGRELSDLYSAWEAAVDPQYGDLAKLGEQVFVNLPGGSRINSIARTAADDRLSVRDKAIKLLINNVAGLKVTDIDQERTKKLAARNTLNELLSTVPGVRTYENITVPPEVLASMPKEQQDLYLLYKVIQAEAAKRARDKKRREETVLDPMQVLGVLR